jgi:drug/metabolite transporter (DMT)-like permease
VNTALAFTLWNVAHAHLTATETSVINNTMLVQIAMLGWLLLDEPLGRSQVAAIVLVSVGAALTQMRRPFEDPRKSPGTRLT